MGHVDELLPVFRAMLRRTRLYARLEARRRMQDMRLAARGERAAWEADDDTASTLPWEAIDQADAREVLSLLRTWLARIAAPRHLCTRVAGPLHVCRAPLRLRACVCHASPLVLLRAQARLCCCWKAKVAAASTTKPSRRSCCKTNSCSGGTGR